MLSTLPNLQSSPADLAKFLSSLTPLCTSAPTLFAPHLNALLGFLPALILPVADCGPTPTVAKPFPSPPKRSFSFPPTPASPPPRTDATAEDTAEAEKDEMRKAALEFMVSLSEAKPSMVRKVPGWVAAAVRGCLEGMGEFEDDAGSLEVWLDADVRYLPFVFIVLEIRCSLIFLACRRSYGRHVPSCIRTVLGSACVCSRGQVRTTARISVYPLDAR
jgi:importin-5